MCKNFARYSQGDLFLSDADKKKTKGEREEKGGVLVNHLETIFGRPHLTALPMDSLVGPGLRHRRRSRHTVHVIRSGAEIKPVSPCRLSIVREKPPHPI